MKRRTFLTMGTGIALGAALAACGGGGHDGGKVEPEPNPPRVAGNDAGTPMPRAVRPDAFANGCWQGRA